MRNFNNENLTGAVLERLHNCTTPRTRAISEAVVRHLHALVREVRPTQEEWRQAIDFLTDTGHLCTSTRQEFILLSDALGVSMLVDALTHATHGSSTPTTVLGPFYLDDSQRLPLGSDIARTGSGELMHVEGSVSNANGQPIANAQVEVWHADGEGFYDVQRSEDEPARDRRAILHTDEHGRFWFRSRVPLYYPIPSDGPVGRMLKAQGRHPFRPAHVHFMISAPHSETLVTHLFLDADPYLDSDVVFGVKDALIKKLQWHPAGLSPAGHRLDAPMQVLHYDFTLANALAGQTCSGPQVADSQPAFTTDDSTPSTNQ
jgi:hydroxyquinol 1,2-dioxygenase